MIKVYPFLSKKQIASRLAVDNAFVLECLSVLWARQTASEQDSGKTSVTNKMGFMCSHAKPASDLAKKAASGEELSEDEISKARSIVSRYTKQLAKHLRAVAVAENPDLAEAGRLFSAV
jgi:hypothetical protein